MSDPRLRFLALIPLVVSLLSGCATAHVDWYAIHEARSELAGLQVSPYAELVSEETAAAAAVLEQANAALADGQLDTVAQISRLALLRVQYAYAVGRTRAARAELAAATEALEAAALRADSARKDLAHAQEELRQSQSAEPPERSAAQP